MGIEIERKFLLLNDQWKYAGNGSPLTGTVFKQGYLPTKDETVVRVRIEGERAKLTLKGEVKGISRLEYEYDIPISDAQELLNSLCLKPIIEKTRYCRNEGTLTWEIDVFGGVNQGLVIAEVELENENQAIALPSWLGEEVSGDPRYYNVNLIDHPFCDWGE